MLQRVNKPLVLIENEPATGDVDGVNVSFTTAHNFVPGSLRVYLNGLRQAVGVGNDYIEGILNTFTMSFAPQAGDVIVVDYQKK